MPSERISLGRFLVSNGASFRIKTNTAQLTISIHESQTEMTFRKVKYLDKGTRIANVLKSRV